jgi:hypothetical protein
MVFYQLIKFIFHYPSSGGAISCAAVVQPPCKWLKLLTRLRVRLPPLPIFGRLLSRFISFDDKSSGHIQVYPTNNIQK